MSRVLILGNGISRLQYTGKIAAWPDEIWCCNYAFVEFGNRISRVAGHLDVMEQAEIWRDLHGYDYRIMQPEDYKHLPSKLRGNSGVYLVSQALDDGYDPIILCGYDFGGKDIWTPGMEDRNVGPGMRQKWKKLILTYPEARDRIRFWKIKPGYDDIDESFRSIYMLAEKENVRLRRELKKLMVRKYKYSKHVPAFPRVNEKSRGKDFYRAIMNPRGR